MKNNLIIFSKNRACQLELLLNSINENSNNVFDQIIVLYRFDNDEYKNGYDKLILNHNNIVFVNENNFYYDLLNLISDDYDFTTFLVDDAVLFKPIPLFKNQILELIDDDTICFSLRLGFNCVYSHPANITYKLGKHQISNDIISFDYTEQEVGDFKYPLSTDGHIFKTKTIKSLLLQIPFNNPNSLEASLQVFINRIPKKIHCFFESKIVSIPANLVNTTFINRHGLEHFMSEKDLNDKFILGESIDLSNLNFEDVNGPHKEIKYIFKTN